MAYARGHHFAWGILAAVVLFVLLAELVIVLLNDYADREADAVHRRLFPQLLDPRVITETWLRPASVLFAGALGVAGLAVLGFLLGHLGQRPDALYLFGAGLALVWVYSFPPVKLNYRGFGEVLEGAGVGLLLPLTGYYLLSGEWARFSFVHSMPIGLLTLVSALASGLKHEPGDRASGKQTWTVRYGAGSTRRLILGLQLGAVVSCLGLGVVWGWSIWLNLFGVLGALWAIRQGGIWRHRADYKDLPALKVYKQTLNRGYHLTCLGLVLDLISRG
jgi:1,4-dihydroxy-2-naphthoate octaprenyltransferase